MSDYQPYEHLPGGFSLHDGTIDFYLRVRSLCTPSSVVLDLGAGRAAWFESNAHSVAKWVRHLAPDVNELIAVDIDAAVLENRSATRVLVMQDGKVPLADASIDVILADYVLEHVADTTKFRDEVARLLKPGGFLCARTPHRNHYVAIASRLLRGPFQKTVVGRFQPDRDAQDIFPTVYRLNTLRAIRGAFPGWPSKSFIFPADPGYFRGSRWIYWLMASLHRIMPAAWHGNLFIFLQKPIG